MRAMLQYESDRNHDANAGHRVAAAAPACIATVAPSMPGRTEGSGSPIYGVTIPAGYRQWKMAAPSYEAGLHELRVTLGNPMAIGAFRDAMLPVLGVRPRSR